MIKKSTKCACTLPDNIDFYHIYGKKWVDKVIGSHFQPKQGAKNGDTRLNVGDK
jgi:hypothetical protein